MNSTLTTNVGSIPWNWTAFCSTGLKPFESDSNDFLPCFQEVFLQLPIFALFAICSSYYCGIHEAPVVRDQAQIYLIHVRITASAVAGSIPVLQALVLKANDVKIYPAEVLLTCTQFISWIVHIGFLLTQRRYGGLNHRGPLALIVVWTAVLVLDFVWLKSSISHQEYWPWSLIRILANCSYLLTFIPKGHARLTRSRVAADEEQQSLLRHRYVYFNADFNETILGHAQDEANSFSKLLFIWVNPLISKGVAGHLKKIEDLFDLPECLSVTRISERLQQAISSSSSLFWALHKAFGREFYLIGLYRFIADTAGFAGPLLLGGLLKESTTENAGTDVRPYFYALGLLAASLISAFCSTHFNWRMSLIGMKMRSGVVSAIYRKALEARGLQDARPEILNLMSTDTDRIVNSCISFHSFWSIPLQLFTTLYLLYVQLGAAFIAGVIFAATLIPINRWLAVKISKFSQGLMSAKDGRLSAISETIIGAKQIKLHAWEDVFISKIRALRQKEISFLAKRKYLDAMCVYFWATTPVLMCLLTFSFSTLLGNPLTAATTYTSVALLNMLIGPLNAFPWVLNGLIEAWISIRRVQELLNLSNLDFSSYYQPIMEKASKSVDSKPSVLQIKDCSFQHETRTSKQESDFTFHLDNVNLDVKEGELVCIEGPVGGGKSSLLSAIVASMYCTEGKINIQNLNAGFGYVPQTTWLQRGTIRENIIWGSVYDEQRYRTIINACALAEDLAALGGDQVGVGENGRTLSGGQRARVCLARAIYQDKKIYILDDILSALDAHVANHIVRHCILGILKNKTRLIVTQNRTLFFHANQILHVENGTISPSVFNDSFELDEDDYDGYGGSMFTTASTSKISDDSDKKSVDSMFLEEKKEYGTLSANVILTYWNAMSKLVGGAVIFFVIFMQVSRNVSDAWLAHWVTDTTIKVNNETNASWLPEEDFATNHTLGYWLGIYTGLAVTNSVLTLARAFIFAYAGIKSAKFIHDKLLTKVLYTRFSFFDITSAGRILNRFSSDTYTIDDTLPFILNILLAQVFGLLGALLVSLYAMPWLGLIIIPMIPIYFNIQHSYRHASRDIKRLSSNALSPIYTHFTETLQGLTVIRAMRAGLRFQSEFILKLEESIKAQLTSAAAQQWLALRLQILGAFLVGGAGFLAAITSAQATSPGLVGLAISYALSITGLLSGVLNALAETEQEMIAVERVNQYLNLPEEDNANGSMHPPFAWPSQGVVTFKDVSMSYRQNLTPALRNLNFRTHAYERVAIVGRTGAGKSSILAALLRVVPLLQGEISVDCVNLRTLSLRVLRDRIVIIPQEPFLFEGTVRENLDPRRNYIDSEIWNAITNCLATPLVQSLGGLSGWLEKGGSNLSAGQKQLLCLTRALLKNSKVVCIDEGTSNLDTDSEAAIQIVLRNAFKSSTVLFIAHRLKGLQNMDSIIVMDNGEIIEEGSPRELGSNTESIFYSMLQEQQNKDFQSSDN